MHLISIDLLINRPTLTLRNGFRSVTKALYNAGLQTAKNVLNVKTTVLRFRAFLFFPLVVWIVRTVVLVFISNFSLPIDNNVVIDYTVYSVITERSELWK